MSSHKPQDWSKWLPMVEFWYNSNYHSSLKMSTFQAFYGYKPPVISTSLYLKNIHTEVVDQLEERRRIASLMKESLSQAQSRMKSVDAMESFLSKRSNIWEYYQYIWKKFPAIIGVKKAVREWECHGKKSKC
ncbi:hypothetical protein LIER_29635 [Lithospermum erythrorhizon]|uniref:Uncharacterized protein n=1 Tax=Lithospermum erythrorhizon TaxID=34254 RepID=A0AAV3RMS7_LITER